MTLLSAVVLGTDVFALPHRGRPCTGAFVVLCEQVSVSVAQWKKSHSLMNLKIGRKVCSFKYYMIWFMSVNMCLCGPLRSRKLCKHPESKQENTCFQSVFSCKLWQSSFSSLQVANVFAIGKSLKITYRRNFVIILWWAGSISLHTFAPALACFSNSHMNIYELKSLHPAQLHITSTSASHMPHLFSWKEAPTSVGH